MPPALVNTWWASLTEDERREAMDSHPDELRNLDGIPVEIRDALNRVVFQEEISQMEEVVGDGPLPGYHQDLKEALEDDDAFFIFYDPMTLGGGEAVISMGNPDRADNVSTMVPGMFNDIGTLDSPIERAETIRNQMHDSDPESEHASIVWMGYNAPPDGGWDPQEGADALVEFQDGLRATHEGTSPSHNSVLGHSYGGYVVGAADNPEIGGGLNADELFLVGAPGASVDHIEDLSMDENNVHIIQGDDDWIEDARDWLGPTVSGFGRPLDEDRFYPDPQDPGTELGNRLDPEADTGHSGYFTDEDTLDYLGDVMTGNENE